MQIVMICENLNCVLCLFKIILSVLNALNYDKQLLIISFIVSLCEYHLSQVEHNKSSVIFFFLSENVRYYEL